MSIEFKYVNYLFSYINLVRAIRKIERMSRNPQGHTLVFVRGGQCVVIGFPVMEIVKEVQ